MVNDKNTQRNISAIISMLTSQGESSCYLSKVLTLGHKLVLGKPLSYTSNW
jgi:hypothetical protein